MCELHFCTRVPFCMNDCPEIASLAEWQSFLGRSQEGPVPLLYLSRSGILSFLVTPHLVLGL